MIEKLQHFAQVKDILPELALPRLSKPISVEGWQQVEIESCDEKMISLSQFGGSRIVVRPAYYEADFCNAEEEQFVRSGVFYKLREIAEGLPQGYKLVILDGWRSLELQEEIYNRFYKSLKRAYPQATAEELHQLCQNYVSLPSDDELCPSPHYTGGAVDLTLQDEKGYPIWMGTDFDDFTDKASSNYYEKEWKILEDRDRKAKINRRLLHAHMVRNGKFTNYPEEWWHFDYGNQFWGKVTGNNAIYGLPIMWGNHP